MANESVCTSCKVKVANLLGSARFKCPNCSNAEIVRCPTCRKNISKYTCPSCKFTGPN